MHCFCEACLLCKPDLFSASWKALDGRPQVFILLTQTIGPCHRHDNIFECPTLSKHKHALINMYLFSFPKQHLISLAFSEGHQRNQVRSCLTCIASTAGFVELLKSSTATFAPGFNTRCSSLRALGMFATFRKPYPIVAASNELLSNGSCCASPWIHLQKKMAERDCDDTQ